MRRGRADPEPRKIVRVSAKMKAELISFRDWGKGSAEVLVAVMRHSRLLPRQTRSPTGLAAGP